MHAVGSRTGWPSMTGRGGGTTTGSAPRRAACDTHGDQHEYNGNHANAACGNLEHEVPNKVRNYMLD
jgi:hypothetical protein